MCIKTPSEKSQGTITLKSSSLADFINAGTTDGLEKTLPGFVPGVVVQVKAIPYNDGGDGPESPVADVTVT